MLWNKIHQPLSLFLHTVTLVLDLSITLSGILVENVLNTWFITGRYFIVLLCVFFVCLFLVWYFFCVCVWGGILWNRMKHSISRLIKPDFVRFYLPASHHRGWTWSWPIDIQILFTIIHKRSDLKPKYGVWEEAVTLRDNISFKYY